MGGGGKASGSRLLGAAPQKGLTAGPSVGRTGGGLAADPLSTHKTRPPAAAAPPKRRIPLASAESMDSDDIRFSGDDEDDEEEEARSRRPVIASKQGSAAVSRGAEARRSQPSRTPSFSTGGSGSESEEEVRRQGETGSESASGSSSSGGSGGRPNVVFGIDSLMAIADPDEGSSHQAGGGTSLAAVAAAMANSADMSSTILDR